MTPIFHAVKNGNVDLVRLLVSRDVNLNIITKFNDKLEDHVQVNNKIGIMKILRTNGYIDKENDLNIFV